MSNSDKWKVVEAMAARPGVDADAVRRILGRVPELHAPIDHSGFAYAAYEQRLGNVYTDVQGDLRQPGLSVATRRAVLTGVELILDPALTSGRRGLLP